MRVHWKIWFFTGGEVVHELKLGSEGGKGGWVGVWGVGQFSDLRGKELW